MSRSLAVLALALVAGADWPQWRGPTGQGHADAPSLPLEWGEDKNVAWKVEVPGKGWSSPAVVGGKIYLTTATPGDNSQPEQSLRALCLDAATGKILWDVEVFRQAGADVPKIHAKNSHASPSPVVSGDAVYVHFGHMGTARLKASDGSAVWTSRKIPYKPVHGNGGSPALWRDRLLFVAIDSPTVREVVAYDAATGDIAWEHKRKQPADRAFSFGTPLVVTIDGQETVIAPGSDVVNALDPATGDELWHVTYSGFSMVPRPIVVGGLIVMSTGFETPQLIAIRPERSGSKWSAKVEWRAKADAPASSSPVAAGAEVFMVSDGGIMTCLDAKTGERRWRERVPGGYTAALLEGAGRVYALNEVGTCTVVKAGTEFEVLATNKLDGRTLASLAVDGGELLLRTDKHLYRIRQ